VEKPIIQETTTTTTTTTKSTTQKTHLVYEKVQID
jgi:hypothetical protein